LLLLLVALKTGLFPVGGMRSLDGPGTLPSSGLADLAAHLVLPACALVLLNVPVIARHVRASLIDALDAPFLQAVRARGVPRQALIFRHALRAASNPLVSLFGLSVGGLLSTSLVVEALMSWPGLGPLLLDAILARDVHVVIGAVLCSTLLLIGGNIAADLLLYATDPRTRTEQG
jgi:peptide/nickel transport system permease protein